MAERNLHEKIEKIEKVEKVDTSTPKLDVAQTEEVSAPTKVKFDAAIEKAESKWDQSQHQRLLIGGAGDSATHLSPITEMSINEKRIDRLKPVTADTIIQQGTDTKDQENKIIAQIEDVQKNNPDAKISVAHDAILTDKLIHVDSSLKTSLSKVGVEVKALDIIPSAEQNPLRKFLNYLSNSDRRLSTMVSEIQSLNVTKERLTPEKLLALQIKLNFIQQELEFFTNVLNKAVEGTKTIMNVQV